MYDAALLKYLADWCKAHGVLLIVDEIAMGMGRTGKMFAYEHAKINPDIVCLGKALSAGYLPISATIVRDSIYQTFDDEHTLQHGHTFCGNPIAAAAAGATLDVFQRDNIVKQAAGVGDRLRQLTEPLKSLPAVKEVRFLGALAVVELNPVEGRPRRVREKMMEAGILLRPLGNVVYLMPPLVISNSQLTELVEILAAALLET